MERKDEKAFIDTVGQVASKQSEVPLLQFIINRYDTGAFTEVEFCAIMGFYTMVAAMYGSASDPDKRDNTVIGVRASDILRLKNTTK